ncbi:hypothetical protein K439DRAFT_1022874 [Ramaria rubella]|nr:hypothetical protein K439DRAFT_1022874 [Ramaria rubella]
MSAAEQAAAQLQELSVIIQGLTVTKYLSAAGFIVLLYDHLLLFGDETQYIWRAKWSWSKALFLFNRYTVPFCITITTYQLSGLSGTGLSTEAWLVISPLLGAASLAIANVFVVQRVYALWSRSKQMLKLTVTVFVLVYIATLVLTVLAIVELRPLISYSPIIGTCVISQKPKMFIGAFSVPLFFDIFLFMLTCWNAFDRPRHMHTAIVKQLYFDGVVYFIVLSSLRLFNICVVAAAPLAYMQLGVYFIWAMITATINRMLITVSTSFGDSLDAQDMRLDYDYDTPIVKTRSAFELSELIAGGNPETPSAKIFSFKRLSLLSPVLSMTAVD